MQPNGYGIEMGMASGVNYFLCLVVLTLLCFHCHST